MHDHKFTDAASVRSFVLGGNALFTVRSEATGTRFTYKVRASEDKTSQPDYESTAGPARRRAGAERGSVPVVLEADHGRPPAGQHERLA